MNNSNDHNYKLFFVKGFYAATTSLVGCLVPRVVVVTSVAACLRECEGNSICQPVKETLGHGPQQHGSHWMLLVAVQFIPLGSVLFLYLRNQMLQSRVELLATFISFFFFFSSISYFVGAAGGGAVRRLRLSHNQYNMLIVGSAVVLCGVCGFEYRNGFGWLLFVSELFD